MKEELSPPFGFMILAIPLFIFTNMHFIQKDFVMVQLSETIIYTNILIS